MEAAPIAVKRVLVAESDNIVLALVSHILTRQGYSVDVASNADEAAARLKATVYDALLIEVKLPGGGVVRLRDFIADPAQRLIVLTPGHSDPGIPARAILRKPIEFGLLVETVASCVKASD